MSHRAVPAPGLRGMRAWLLLLVVVCLMTGRCASGVEDKGTPGSPARALSKLTEMNAMYHSSAELSAYYAERVAAVPSMMRIESVMEDVNENNPDATRRASPILGHKGKYPDPHCDKACQETRTLSVIHLSEDVGKGKQDKTTVLLLFGEHAREDISDEVCLFLVQLFTGDVDAIDAHTGGAVWEEMVKFVYRMQRFGDLGMSDGKGKKRIESVKPAFTGFSKDAGVPKNFHEEKYQVDDVEEVKQAMLDWAQALMARSYVLLVPNALRDGRVQVEDGEHCMRMTPELGDLNRDYSFHWKRDSDGSSMPRAFFAWPSRIVAQVALRESPSIFTNYHSGEFAFYFPWDFTQSRPDDLPDNFDEAVAHIHGVCDCNHGIASVMSGYAAYGAAIDYMYGVAKVPYTFTVEVFGPNERGRYGKPLHEDPSLFPRNLPGKEMCFWDFNPVSGVEYSDTLAMWAAATMVLMRDVIEHEEKHPRSHAKNVPSMDSSARLTGAGTTRSGQDAARSPYASYGFVALLLAGFGVYAMAMSSSRGRKKGRLYNGREMTV